MCITTTSIVLSALLDLELALSREELLLWRRMRSATTSSTALGSFTLKLLIVFTLGATWSSSSPTASSATSSARFPAFHLRGPQDPLHATTLGPRPTLRPRASSARWEPTVGQCSQAASRRPGGGGPPWVDGSAVPVTPTSTACRCSWRQYPRPDVPTLRWASKADRLLAHQSRLKHPSLGGGLIPRRVDRRGRQEGCKEFEGRAARRSQDRKPQTGHCITSNGPEGGRWGQRFGTTLGVRLCASADPVARGKASEMLGQRRWRSVIRVAVKVCANVHTAAGGEVVVDASTNGGKDEGDVMRWLIRASINAAANARRRGERIGTGNRCWKEKGTKGGGRLHVDGQQGNQQLQASDGYVRCSSYNQEAHGNRSAYNLLDVRVIMCQPMFRRPVLVSSCHAIQHDVVRSAARGWRCTKPQAQPTPSARPGTWSRGSPAAQGAAAQGRCLADNQHGGSTAPKCGWDGRVGSYVTLNTNSSSQFAPTLPPCTAAPA